MDKLKRKLVLLRQRLQLLRDQEKERIAKFREREVEIDTFGGIVIPGRWHDGEMYGCPVYSDGGGRVSTAVTDWTVWDVLKRHRNKWKTALVVTDISLGMTVFDAQLLGFHRRYPQIIKHFTVFNDGDKTAEIEKKIGQTGGVYQADSE